MILPNQQGEKAWGQGLTRFEMHRSLRKKTPTTKGTARWGRGNRLSDTMAAGAAKVEVDDVAICTAIVDAARLSTVGEVGRV